MKKQVTYYCRTDHTYFAAEVDNPEKNLGYCPCHNKPCNLIIKPLDEVKKSIGLAADELGQGVITIRPL